MAENQPIPDIRPLTHHERALLKWLLQHGTPEAKTYLPQLPHVTVISRCPCGCPTIDLAVNGQTAPIETTATVLADIQATSPEGIPVGILLFARQGLLDTLEIYPCSDATHFTWPQLKDLPPSLPSPEGDRK
jgi:hypothetical protein